MAIGEGDHDESINNDGLLNIWYVHREWPMLVGVIMVIIGVSSYIFHASLSYFGWFMDFANICFMLLFMTYYTVVNYYNLELTDERSLQLAVSGFIFSWSFAYAIQFMFSW